MTSEQLEAARAERMRQNGLGALTLEDARTWIEETGLCLFLPRKQSTPSLAPSFVEAVAGERNSTPPQKQISTAEELLVRLELEGVAVRLNLAGIPGEQPDYVVAAWVLPYVYALRGDRDWRRTPQLTGSRQVSPLAIQAYKRLEQGEATIAELRQVLDKGVTETAVLRAITELWQQLRIIPVISAPGKPAKWQLLKVRFQKAIAEGASTSQVTAISVLASIFLQAVIAASMEEVELFLAALTARSKIREVLRGLVATRQVHTLSLGHAPHFYVAGTLPEFSVAPSIYASSSLSSYTSGRFESTYSASYNNSSYTSGYRSGYGSSYVHRDEDHRDQHEERATPPSANEHAAAKNGNSTGRNEKNGNARAHFSRPAAHGRDRKPVSSNGNGRGTGHGTTGHGSGHTAKSSNGSRGATSAKARPSGLRSAKAGASGRKSSLSRSSATTRTEARSSSRPGTRTAARRKPALATGGSKSYSFNGKHGSKKRG